MTFEGHFQPKIFYGSMIWICPVSKQQLTKQLAPHVTRAARAAQAGYCLPAKCVFSVFTDFSNLKLVPVTVLSTCKVVTMTINTVIV